MMANVGLTKLSTWILLPQFKVFDFSRAERAVGSVTGGFCAPEFRALNL
jgi:hypothetical protein